MVPLNLPTREAIQIQLVRTLFDVILAKKSATARERCWLSFEKSPSIGGGTDDFDDF